MPRRRPRWSTRLPPTARRWRPCSKRWPPGSPPRSSMTDFFPTPCRLALALFDSLVEQPSCTLAAAGATLRRPGQHMTSPLKPAVDNSDTQTIAQPAQAAKHAARGKVCCAKREIHSGSGAHLTKEAEALLRLRLRDSAFIL